jgi:hypothetical protein
MRNDEMTDLENIKRLAGLNEMDGPPPADPIGVAGNLKQSAEDLYAIIQGGRGNPMGVISQMENGLNALKQHFASAPRQ